MQIASGSFFLQVFIFISQKNDDNAICNSQQKVFVHCAPCGQCPQETPATGNNTTTQTDLPRKHAAIQVSKCRVCLCFLLVSDDSSEYTCGRYAQVEEPVSLVLKLQEKVGRLKSIRVSEKDWCNHTLLSLRQIHQPATTQEVSVPYTLTNRQQEGT